MAQTRRTFLALSAAGSFSGSSAPHPSDPSALWTASGLHFEQDGVRLAGGLPSATLLVGDAELVVRLQPRPRTRISDWHDALAGRAVTGRTHTTWHDDGYELAWSTGRSADGDIILSAAVYNGSEAAVRLREIVLWDTVRDGVTVAGDPAEWLLSTTGSDLRVGTMAETLKPMSDPVWSGFGGRCLIGRACADDPCWRTYQDALALYTDRGRRGIVLSAAGQPCAHLRFDCRVQAGRMRLVITSEMTDVLLEPGETRQAQTLLIAAGPYEAAMERALRLLAVTHGARPSAVPVVGWCSWYDLLDKIHAGEVNAVAAAASEIKAALPLQVIQIDDGYQREWGDWNPNDKFPGGWQPVVSRIRAAGATPGIWLAPLSVRNNALGLVTAHPDWFQKDSRGNLIGTPEARWIDPTHPEAKQFLRGIIRDARAEGFEYFKIDYNEVHDTCRFHDSRKTRLEAYRDLYRLYREEIGNGYLLACAGFTRGVMGFADAARIGWDSRARWTFKPGEPPICISECIRCTGRTAIANGILFANDPDVTYLKARDTLSETELRTWHGFVGLLGGAMMISEPLQHADYRARLRHMEILSPPAPDRARGIDATDRDYQQFQFVAQRPWGSFAAVLLWNPAAEPRRARLSMRGLEALGLQFHAWSFWDAKYLGVAGPNFTTPLLPPHGSILLRLTPVAERPGIPVVVGSDLHIAMGSAEIKTFAATPRRMRLELDGAAGARDGHVWIHSPGRVVLRSAAGCDAAVETGGPGLWKLRLSKRVRENPQALALETQ